MIRNGVHDPAPLCVCSIPGLLMNVSQIERFHVVYDGPALTEHQMDVRDLAPALVAFADLFAAVNKQVNGGSAEVRVQVKNFKSGSFGIDLVASQHLLSQIKDIFAGSSATAICNAHSIMSMIGLVGGGGLISVLRRLRGRHPVRIERNRDAADVWVTETEVVHVGAQVFELYQNVDVRTSLAKVLSPLERDGITGFGVISDDQVVLNLHDDEVCAFGSATTGLTEIVSTAVLRKMLQIESLTFKDGNKWRVHDGMATFYASIEDQEFIAKIDGGQRFGKGDVLIVDLRQVQSVGGGRLMYESAIVKVLEHREPLQQVLL